MRCTNPNCPFENPEGSKFCGNCGWPIKIVHPQTNEVKQDNITNRSSIWKWGSMIIILIIIFFFLIMSLYANNPFSNSVIPLLIMLFFGFPIFVNLMIKERKKNIMNKSWILFPFLILLFNIYGLGQNYGDRLLVMIIIFLIFVIPAIVIDFIYFKPSLPTSNEGNEGITGIARMVQITQQQQKRTLLLDNVINFRLEQTDDQGNVIDFIPVEMRGLRIQGLIADGDKVKVKGKMKYGTILTKEILNISTNSIVMVK